MGDAPSIITRLGYDASDLAAGLAKARADVAAYKADAVLIQTQLNQAKLTLLTQYSAANRAATAENIANLQSELASTIGSLANKSAAEKAAINQHLADLRAEYAAEQANLSGYDQAVAKVNQLKAAYLEASSAAKQSQAAVGLFANASGQPSMIDVLQQTLAKVSAIIPGISRIGQLVGGVSFSSGLVSAAGAPEAAASGAAVGAEGAAATGAEAASVTALTGAMGSAGVAAGALGGIEALLVAAAAKVTLAMMDQAQAINNVSAATGLTTKQVQQYTELASEMGIDSGAITQDFARLEAQLGKFLVTGKGAEESIQQFVSVLNGFGIPIQNATGQLRPVNDIISDFADKLQAIPDATTRTAFAMDALGVRGKVLAEVINQASNEGKSFSQVLAEIGESGVIIPDSDIQNLQKAKTAWDEITRSISGYITQAKEAIAQGFLSATGIQTILSTAPGPQQAAQQAVDKIRTQKLPPLSQTETISVSMSNETAAIQKDRTALAEAEEKAREKQLPVDQQILLVNQKLAALKKAANDPSISTDALDQNLKDQIKLQGQIGELAGKSVADINKVADAYRAVQDQVNKNSEAFGEIATQDILHPKTAFESKPTAEDQAVLDTQLKIAAVKQQIIALDKEDQDLKSGNTGSINNPETAGAAGMAKLRQDQARDIASSDPSIGGSNAKKADIEAAQAQNARISQEQIYGKYIAANSDAIIHNAGLQKEALAELAKLEEDLHKQQQAVAISIQEQMEKTIEDSEKAVSATGSDAVAGLIGLGPKAQAPTGALPVSDFSSQLDSIKALHDSGQTSAQDEIDSLKALTPQLDAEIAAQQEILDTTQKTDASYASQLARLAAMVGLVKSIATATADAAKQTPLAGLLGSMKDFGNIISKFDPGIGKEFTSSFQGLETITKSLASLTTLEQQNPTTQNDATGEAGGQPSSLMDILTGKSGGTALITGALDLSKIGTSMIGEFSSLLSGPGGASGAASGAVSMGSMGAGVGEAMQSFDKALTSAPLIGGIIGAVTGLVTGLFGSGKAIAAAKAQATAITTAMNGIVQSLNLGNINLSQAIQQSQTQLTAANNISGKGTASTQLQLQQQITNQINQLQAQQKQILDNFAASLGVLQTSLGNQSAVQSIQKIAQALAQAAGAGASANDQLTFFNDSIAQLATSLGTTLTQDEQNVLGMMRQSLDLSQQQQDIITNAANQELSIRQSLGVTRTLTPAQSAAQQIAAIEQQKQKQLAALTEQKNMLDAQIGGQAQLFGLSTADLSVATAKTQVIAEQLALQQQITAQLTAQTTQQKQFYGSLLSGVIPNLPAGTLPSDFNIPAGSSYVFSGGITVNYSGAADPTALASALQSALTQINMTRYTGGQ